MAKFLITYDPVNGDTTQDGLCVGLVDELISINQLASVRYITSSANVITAFRLAAAEKKISVDDIVFFFNGEEITMDSKFEMSAWPKGFCDAQGDMLTKIMQARRKV